MCSLKTESNYKNVIDKNITLHHSIVCFKKCIFNY